MKKNQRIISIFVCLMIFLTTLVINPSISRAATYEDIKDHWAEKLIIELVDKGYVVPILNNGKYEIQPDRMITRIEFLEILMRVKNFTIDASKVKAFSDVFNNDWYKPIIDKASSNDIVSGYPDGTFKPNNPITRAEI